MLYFNKIINGEVDIMLKYRRSILITLDYIMINIFLYLGMVIRFDNEIPLNYFNNYINYSWVYSAVIVYYSYLHAFLVVNNI
jgi:hypothetical protein